MSPPTSGSAAAPADTPAPAMEPPTFAWPTPGVWQCPDCGCRSWTRFDVPARGSGYIKGEGVRCNECKREHYPDARRAASGSLPGGEREALEQAAKELGALPENLSDASLTDDSTVSLKVRVGLLRQMAAAVSAEVSPVAGERESDEAFLARCARGDHDALAGKRAPPPPAAEPVAWAPVRDGALIVAHMATASRESCEANARLHGWPEPYRIVPLYTAPQPGRAEAKELREALNAVLETSGARKRYHARKYAEAVERAERLLAPPPGDAQEAQ